METEGRVSAGSDWSWTMDPKPGQEDEKNIWQMVVTGQLVPM